MVGTKLGQDIYEEKKNMISGMPAAKINNYLILFSAGIQIIPFIKNKILAHFIILFLKSESKQK